MWAFASLQQWHAVMFDSIDAMLRTKGTAFIKKFNPKQLALLCWAFAAYAASKGPSAPPIRYPWLPTAFAMVVQKPLFRAPQTSKDHFHVAQQLEPFVRVPR